MIRIIRRTALCGAAILVGMSVPGATQQRSEPPIARYTMDAGTTSGMAAMGAGGGNPLALLRGGGGAAAHELVLRLGSSQAASGSPEADHFMPGGAGLGTSVPLVTPVRQPVTTGGTTYQAQGGQLPSGKLYIYWGCGERAGPGQPVVIDFANMAAGQVPPNLFASVDVSDEWRVTDENSKTYGDWPNGKDTKVVPASASLRGDHRIAGTYSPEIAFRLDRDFMPALQPRSSVLPSGAYALTWNGLPEATGYYAWAMGAKNMGRGQASEMVWWTSSATQQFGGALADWLSPAAVSKLVGAKTVLPPSQTDCAIPAEVREAGGEAMMLNLYAYGPESDFAYPARPADPKVTWKPDWITRVRFRSNAMVMLGMPDMGGFGAGDDAPEAQAEQAPPADARPKCPKGLKGIAARAAGLCG
jgi:hypothetical protein